MMMIVQKVLHLSDLKQNEQVYLNSIACFIIHLLLRLLLPLLLHDRYDYDLLLN